MTATAPTRRRPPLVLLLGGLVALAVLLSPLSSSEARPDGNPPPSASTPRDNEPVQLHAAKKATKSVPPAKHVFVINIENKGYDETWGPGSKAPYLAKTLRSKGVLLTNYYGTAHNSEANYVAQISGQGPNADMQADCQTYNNFVSTGTAALGQARGTGCVFPSKVPSLPIQLNRKHLLWRGYMDDMKTPCEHPQIGSQDQTQKATAKAEYATRHNPFAYFHAIIDHQRSCQRHVVPLTQLTPDLHRSAKKRSPSLFYITPDLCDDGHDAPCADGRPGGLTSVNAWMKKWVPRILHSRVFKQSGVLIITADESDGVQSDSTACCNEQSLNTPMAGIAGKGGGLIGALVISRWTSPDTYSDVPYNHYSLLGSMENIFGVPRLGYAAAKDLDTFGLDVFNNHWNDRTRARHR